MIDDATLAKWEHSEYPWAAEMAREIRRLREELRSYKWCLVKLAEGGVIRPTNELTELETANNNLISGLGADLMIAQANLAAHRAVVRAAEAYLDAQDDRLKAMIAKPKDVEQPSWLDHIRRLRTKLLDALVHPLVVAARKEPNDVREQGEGFPHD